MESGPEFILDLLRPEDAGSMVHQLIQRSKAACKNGQFTDELYFEKINCI